MIIVSGPYNSKDLGIKANRIKIIANACSKIMTDKINPVAISPLLYGLSVIEKSGVQLPDTYEFWNEFCRAFIRMASIVYVLDLEGWEDSTGVKDEIKEAKQLNIPVYLVNAISLNFIKSL